MGYVGGIIYITQSDFFFFFSYEDQTVQKKKKKKNKKDTPVSRHRLWLIRPYLIVGIMLGGIPYPLTINFKYKP